VIVSVMANEVITDLESVTQPIGRSVARLSRSVLQGEAVRALCSLFGNDQVRLEERLALKGDSPVCVSPAVERLNMHGLAE
jgi:hypothetical protein